VWIVFHTFSNQQCWTTGSYYPLLTDMLSFRCSGRCFSSSLSRSCELQSTFSRAVHCRKRSR